jgi:sialate O-acetylesterase
MRVRFAPMTSGLDTVDGAPPRGFIVAGADRVWHTADARIDGNTVVVSAAAVPQPVAVRYAWGNDPPNTLRNQADLPAPPFRSDDWPMGVARPAPPAAAAR